MTNDELQHHLGNAFQMLKTQAETIKVLNENIERTQHISSTHDQALERHLKRIESRIMEVEGMCQQLNGEVAKIEEGIYGRTGGLNS